MNSLPRRITAEHLTSIRQNTDWRRLFEVLRVDKDTKKSRENDWWGKSPFKPDERTASFHINDRGWYCHATSQGGGALELVQRLHGVHCYEAGRWLVDQGVSEVVADVRREVEASTTKSSSNEEEETAENCPIRQDLCSQLNTEHAAFTAREIPPQVLEDLGAGYLERPPRKNGRPDPINRRLVFQIRGLQEDESGYMRPVILGHTGRATTAEQEQRDGKWWTYAGFKKSLELYAIDVAIFEDEARRQKGDTDHLIIVEGCFDVAKLRAAGIHNAVATFGAHLSQQQLSRLDLIAELTGVDRFFVWYDRDQDGATPHGLGAVKAAELITRRGYEVAMFDWNQSFSSPQRPAIAIPAEITDPAEFSVEQLRWLRCEGWV